MHEQDLLVETDIVVLHGTPMSPLEGDFRRTTIDFQHLPRKGWHHTLEGLVATREVRVYRTVVLIWRNDGIVCSNLEHVLACLTWTSIDGKGVLAVVDCSPIRELRLEGRFDFPVFDEILDHRFEAASYMVHLLGLGSVSLVA